MSEIALIAPGDFGEIPYDSENPTRNTEQLSFYLLQLFAHLAGGGLSIYTNDENPVNVQSEVDSWLTSWGTWLKDTSSAVSAWLTEPEESRALPVILAAPLLPAGAAGAVMLANGIVVKIATDIVSNVAQTYSEIQVARRQLQQSRQFDKAFFDDGWFSAPSPKLDRLIDAVWEAGFAGHSVHPENSNLQVIIEGMVKESVIKVLSHVVINSNGRIDGVDFGLAGDFDMA